jgi:hypothetical protein
MKLIVKQNLVALLLLVGQFCLGESKHSHSFFRARPTSQNGILEHALFKYDIYRNECCSGPTRFHLQAVGFYFHSFDSEKLARYFLPKSHSCMTVGLNNTSDISSPWVGIITPLNNPFESVITIRPERKVGGAAFNLHVDFNALMTCCDYYPWMSIFVPVVHVKHRLRLKEKLKGSLGLPPGFATATEALNNPAWNFGKLSNKELTKSGVDDVSVKLGCDVIHSPLQNLGIYANIFIPTGGTSKAQYLFEPTVGNGNHVGLGMGLSFDRCLWETENSLWAVEGDFRAVYFLKSHERRSFDLCENGDWSRYLLVSRISDVESGIINPLPGINFFTRKVRTTGRTMLEAFLAFHYTRCSFNAEFGYNFWWRQKEECCIPPCNQNIAIFDIAGTCPPGRTSASTAQITGALPGPGGPKSDAQIVPFNQDFNVNSGCLPHALTNSIYAALSYDFVDCRSYKGLLGCGVSYEFAQRNSAISGLGVWLKGSICF